VVRVALNETSHKIFFLLEGTKYSQTIKLIGILIIIFLKINTSGEEGILVLLISYKRNQTTSPSCMILDSIYK